MEHSEQYVPEQEQGSQKDLKHTYTADNAEDAADLFLEAKDRLLDVNNWNILSGVASAIFQLTDHNGHELHRKAHKNDYIRINIPGPGPSSGDGYDWVHIEAIVYDDYPDENSESFTLRLRPAVAPNGSDIAHFFSDDATSTFSIERHGKLLIAYYHGRNEKPNTGNEKLADTVRNTAVALGAILGLSEIQWKSLLKGILSFE